MPDFFYPDGTEIPAGEVSGALKRGEARVPAGAEVRMLDETGKPMFVPGDQFWSLLNSGWKYESPEAAELRKYQEQAGFAEGTKAVAESVGSVATLGASDALLAGIGGDEYRKTRALRDETFETVKDITEGATLVGTALLPGALAARSAKLAQAGVAGAEGTALATTGGALSNAARVAELVPSSLATRAALGVESAFTRGATKALQAAGVSADGTLARAAGKGLGMAAGGATEGALYGAGQGLSETALAPGGDYDRLAENVFSTAKDGAIFGALFGGGLGVAGEAVAAGARKLAKGKTGDQILSDIAEGAAVDAVHPLRKDARAVERSKANFGRQLIDNDITGSTERILERSSVVKRAAADEIDDVLRPIESQIVDSAAIREAIESAKKVVRADEGAILNKQQKAALAEIEAQTADMSARLNRAPIEYRVRNAGGTEIKTRPGGEVSVGELVKFRRALDDAVNWTSRDDTLGQQAIKSVRRNFEDLVESEVGRLGAPESAAKYLAAKEKYQVAAWANGVSKENIARWQANRSIGSLTDVVTATTGAAIGAATGSFGMGAMMAMGAGAVNNFARKRGASIVSSIAEGLRKTEVHVAGKIRGALRPGAARVAAIGKASELYNTELRQVYAREDGDKDGDAYNRLAQKLARASEVAPSQMRVLDHEAPRTGFALKQQMGKAAQFLMSKAPRPPKPTDNPITNRALGWTPPTEGEMQKFARYVAVVNNPLIVLDALDSGRLTLEHTEALRAVYPKMFTAMQGMVMQEVSALNAEPSRDTLIRMGLLFDLPLDPSLDPEHIRINQQVSQMAAAQAQPKATGKQLEVHKNMRSHTDRIESGEMEQL